MLFAFTTALLGIADNQGQQAHGQGEAYWSDHGEYISPSDVAGRPCWEKSTWTSRGGEKSAPHWYRYPEYTFIYCTLLWHACIHAVYTHGPLLRVRAIAIDVSYAARVINLKGLVHGAVLSINRGIPRHVAHVPVPIFGI